MRLIKGNNGGIFFLNTDSWSAWATSLEFYKGVTWKARLKRLALFFAYPILGSNCTRKEMSEYIENATRSHIDVPLESSGIISPTGDKAVVHLHGKGYWKAAAGKSYPKVRGEVEIYRLLAEKHPVKFCFSEISNIHDDGSRISFFMNEDVGVFEENCHKPLEAVLPALEEFHLVTWRCHGDFKPWNVRWRKDGRPHFFDFEEAHSGDIQEDIQHWKESVANA